MKNYTLADYAFQFVTITMGVLIALLINGLVEVNRNRALVREARAMIRQEISDNTRELEGVTNGASKREKDLDDAVRFADDWLTKKKTAVTSIQLQSETAELNSSAWRSAERTGALTHMDYAEVKQYSELYGYQDVYIDLQRKTIDQIATAGSLLASDFDPDNPNLADLQIFRREVLLLLSHQRVKTQLAQGLLEAYDKALKR